MIKRALLVGINAYPDSPLNGCLNDLKLMYKILKEIYGFKEFAILDDKRATKRNWVKSLVNLGKRSKPGDWLVHCYSGHGSQVLCTTETASFEADGMDEIVIPYDYDWDEPFRDDDLNSIIMSIHPEVKIFCLFDSCYSGTVLRNSPPMVNGHPIKSRYLPPPPHIVLESGEVTLDDELRLDTSRHDKSKMKRVPFLREATDQGNAILISGCTDKQTSADAYFETGGGGRYHGAMTYYLARILKEHNWKITYSELITQMNRELERDGFEQSPQLECKQELMHNNFLE
jgi:metacaspase-1